MSKHQSAFCQNPCILHNMTFYNSLDSPINLIRKLRSCKTTFHLLCKGKPGCNFSRDLYAPHILPECKGRQEILFGRSTCTSPPSPASNGSKMLQDKYVVTVTSGMSKANMAIRNFSCICTSHIWFLHITKA